MRQGGQQSGDVVWATRWLAVRPVVLALAATLACTWLLATLGVTGAIDRDVRRLFYGVRGDRAPAARVILVAIDEETARAWGPPPWPWQRYEDTIAAIERGHPRLVAVLEPGLALTPSGAMPAKLAALVDQGGLIVPTEGATTAQPRLVLDPRGAVEAIEVGDADALLGRSTTRRVIERAGLPAPAGAELTVNFFGAGRDFPALPAHRVAAGEFPAEVFADRIVVIGVRGAPLSPEVPTPVGPLSPAEIHVQAIHALALGEGLRQPPAWLGLALVLGFALLGLLLTPRSTSLWFTVGGAALVVTAAVVGSYLLFAHAHTTIDLAAPLSALGVAGVTSALLDRMHVHRELADLSRLAARHLGLTARSRSSTDLDEMWRRFVAGTQTYLDHTGSHFGELPPGLWHLTIERATGFAVGDIVEPRRDVRREPYHAAYASRRPAWASRPLIGEDRGQKTLMVPLTAWRRLIGMWMIHFPVGQEVGERELRLAELLGTQMAFALEARRLQKLVHPSTAEPGTMSSALVAEVRAAEEGALALAHLQEETARLVEALPVGVLTASLWGELEVCNAAMRPFLAACGVELAGKPELTDVVATMTRREPGEVRAILRQLLDRGGGIKLEARAKSALGQELVYDLALSRLTVGEERGAAADRPIGRSHFALTASERTPAALEAPAWSWHGDGKISELVDVRALVAAAAEEVKLGKQAKRPLLVESPEVLPQALGHAPELREAVAILLGELLRTGPADSPGRLVIEERADVLVVRLYDPTSTLPAADARALAAAEQEFDPGSPLYALARAKRMVERSEGSFAIESTLDQGTTIEIVLPIAGRRG